MPTIDQFIRRLEGIERPGILYDDEVLTQDQFARACAERAALLRSLLRPGPPHVGVLLDNIPEFPMWLGATAAARAVLVGINPTRRGEELARDIRHTDCQLIVTENAHLADLEGIDSGVDAGLVLNVDSPEYAQLLAPFAGAPFPAELAEEQDLYLLLFTSGTTGAPKAVKCSQGRLARIGEVVGPGFLGPEAVAYQVMPLFHSNALMAAWAGVVQSAAMSALRRKFSATAFLPDVRKFGVTYFNYVGKPLAYILATPEHPDDADNTLRFAFGNEAAEQDIVRFGKRFGCMVIDGYGSTEGGAFITRGPDTPPNSIGKGAEGTVVLDPDSSEERAVARFDEHGRLLNADEAVGELVNKTGTTSFEGYWNNDEANAARTRNGWYWTGDLAYRDEDGFIYFAGRDLEWLRVDGENFAAAPVERILGRHPDVVLAAVYAVPDVDAGDRVMAALQLRSGASFDGAAFASFVAAQPDMGTKWAPTFVRVEDLPVTPTNKVIKRSLQRDGWQAGPVWWRGDRSSPYRELTTDDRAALRDRYAARGRDHLLPS